MSVVAPDSQSLPLRNFSSTHDLYSAFIKYLEQRDERHFNDPEQNKVFRVTKWLVEENLVKGIIEIGDYGMSAELVDVESSNKTYQKSTTEAEMTPHYFLAYLPPDFDRGIMILQKNSGRGIQTALFADFKKQARTYDPKGKVHFTPLVPKNYIEELKKNGRFTKIRFIKNELPDNITNAYKRDTYEEPEKVEGLSEFTIQPRKNGTLPQRILDWALEAITDKSRVSNMAEVIGHEYDKVKMEIVMGGRKRTINLDNLDSLRTDIDITKTIRTDEGGHPEFSSIDSAAGELLHSILSELGAKDTNVKQN